MIHGVYFLLLSCRTDGDTNIKVSSIDTSSELMDADGDGYYSDEDCDDSEATIHPEAIEICDGRDNNCDGDVDEGVLSEFFWDEDEDGFGDPNTIIEACQVPDNYVPNGNDCDDLDGYTYPAAPERCDDIDNDCDGIVDEDVLLEWYLDEDGDNFGTDYVIEACDPPDNYAGESGDCNDENPDAYPGGEEVCDEIDNNCDGIIDEDLTFLAYVDADEDGFGDDFTVIEVCSLEVGMALTGGDCDDIDSSINPDVDEECDGVDNNCDGVTDEVTAIDASQWYADIDGDGFGDNSSHTIACEAPANHVDENTDCIDTDSTIYPNAPEICDGQVNSCGGTLPNDEIDNDGDGYVECLIDSNGWDGTSIFGGQDCDDSNPTLFPGQIWYADLDGDGFGDAAVSIPSCSQPSNTVLDSTDCNDTEPNQFPGQTWFIDADGDGFGDPNNSISSCLEPNNSTLNSLDCDDGNANYFPGQIWFSDSDGDSFGDPNNSTISCLPTSNNTLDNTDCDDLDSSIYPNALEICDGQINSCGGVLPNDEIDNDGDGYVECSIDFNGWDGTSIAGGLDCDDTTASTFPGATENVGDNNDSDCDGSEICILDADNDGHGNSSGLTQVSSDSDCDDPNEAQINNTDDCDDNNPLTNPTLGCFGIDCNDVLNSGQGSVNGVYTIDPDGPGGNSPYDAYCDQQTDGGGWTRVTHLHPNRDIASINRNSAFFTSAWQQNSSSYTPRSNSTLILDSNTYGMLDATAFLNNANEIRFSCNDTTRGLSARAIWTPSQSQLNNWLTEGNDVSEYQTTSTSVSVSKNNGSFNNANVYLTHTESAYFGSWHVCGTLTAQTGGFQLGFCHNSPTNSDSYISDANQIIIGYHNGFSGLRLECTQDTPRPTSNVNGDFSIWVR